jgi:hypothetical protein
MKTMSLAGAALLALLAGCSSISVDIDYDRAVDFTKLETYDWLPVEKRGPYAGDLVDKRIRAAVEEELAARGLEKRSGGPDLLVAYHTFLKDKVEVWDWGPTYHGRHRYRGSRTEVHTFTEGSLVLDLLDAGKEVVWRRRRQRLLAGGGEDPGGRAEAARALPARRVARDSRLTASGAGGGSAAPP